MDFISIVFIGVQSNILGYLDGLLNDPLLHDDWLLSGSGILINGILSRIQQKCVFYIRALIQRLFLRGYTDCRILIRIHGFCRNPVHFRVALLILKGLVRCVCRNDESAAFLIIAYRYLV